MVKKYYTFDIDTEATVSPRLYIKLRKLVGLNLSIYYAENNFKSKAATSTVSYVTDWVYGN